MSTGTMVSDYRETLRLLKAKEALLTEEVAVRSLRDKNRADYALQLFTTRQMIRDVRAALRQLEPPTYSAAPRTWASLDGRRWADLEDMTWAEIETMNQVEGSDMSWSGAMQADGITRPTKRQCQILALVYGAHMTQGEIAVRLGTVQPVVRRSVPCALARLRRYTDARALDCRDWMGTVDMGRLIRGTHVLSPRQRDTLMLREDGLTEWDIARNTGAAYETVHGIIMAAGLSVDALLQAMRAAGPVQPEEQVYKDTAAMCGLDIMSLRRAMGSSARKSGEERYK